MLQKFGFTQYESNVFEVLTSSREPLDATSIVKYSQVPKSKVYEVLQRLQEKGLILTSFHGKRKLYTALALETTIEKLTSDFEANLEELKTKEYTLPVSDERVWTMENEQSITALLKACIDRATNSILLTGWNDELASLVTDLERKAEQGVMVELLSVGDLDAPMFQSHILHPNETHEALERHKLVIIDSEEMVFAGSESGVSQGIHTLSKPLVKFFTEYFYHDVALAEITEKYKDILMEDEEVKNILMKLRY
ncbi:TrmB family transcriptional regulator [Halobacillus sp. BAB-2008]|uniref:TrmB family transcriptional regulator n=1 Tax=Halobacillus sp. BAB-2008 TaxID=1246484 RepID=UPI0002A4F709|nr:TrmB family transcriptional regulator [Halobacillus sp. BAB-2008]ELK47014.1 TrmB family transcription regulator [Halobacillus sp. BAB-2008]